MTCSKRLVHNVVMSSKKFLLYPCLVLKNILAHEELRDAQSSLKQYQQNIKELEEGLLKKRSEIVNVQESLQATIGELELKV